MILPLAKKNHPVWKQKFQEIKDITPEIKKLVRDMKETLEFTSGVGLAAPQVRTPLRLFIIIYGRLKEVFINPKIKFMGKEAIELEEGCLSVPGARGLTKRSLNLEIEYTDIKGDKKLSKLTGFYARIVQHEYDHLSSTFYSDRIKDKKKYYTYKPIKIVFFGTPKFGAIVLKSLIGQQIVGEYVISLVITASDRTASQKGESQPSPVKSLAIEFNLPVASPSTLKGNRKLINQLKNISPDFIVLASYGKILPKEILEIPKKAALNIHPSLLPKYRGASPIQTAILNGDTFTGITVIKMNEQLDEGEIVATVKTKIASSETTQSLTPKLANLGAKIIHQLLHLMNLNKITPTAQEHSSVAYTKPLSKEAGKIDWKYPPENLDRMVRSYFPWPGVWTIYNGKFLKLLPGEKVQLDGKEPISLKQFKTGHKDFTLNW